MFDLHTSILDSSYGEELDETRLSDYIDCLMAEFAESVEAQTFMEKFQTSLHWPITYMHYAGIFFCATPATITPAESAQILFDIFPRKVSVQADRASEIITELRAFWQYLKRIYSPEHADGILEQLTDEGAANLEAELSDPDNFGMAKLMVMSGYEAGYDMTNEEEMGQFLLAYNEMLASTPAPSTGPNQVSDRMPALSPVRKASRGVGRNKPCPCGSGRKYKKCCGR